MTFEEYKNNFENFLTGTGQVWLDSFYTTNRNFRHILIDMKFRRQTSKRFQGFSQEELIILLYKSNILKEPLDKTFTKLEVNDSVITSTGYLCTVTEIMPSGRVKIRPKNSLEIKTTLSSALVKVNPTVNLEF